MHHFQVTKQHLADRPAVEAFFRKCQKLAHYSRLAEQLRSSPVCMCRECNRHAAPAGIAQLRLFTGL